MKSQVAIFGAFLLFTHAHADITVATNFAARWDSDALQGIRDAKLGAPVVARALAIIHTCMYDAWAAYDDRAVGTQLGGALRRPASERTLANKERAISYAAHRALVDVLPVDTNSVYIPLMKQLGYDPNDNSTQHFLRIRKSAYSRKSRAGWPGLFAFIKPVCQSCSDRQARMSKYR